MAKELFCNLTNMLGHSVFTIKNILSSTWLIIYIDTIFGKSHIKIECRRSFLQKDRSFFSVKKHFFCRN